MKELKKSDIEEGVITRSGLNLNINNGEVRKKNGQKVRLMKHEVGIRVFFLQVGIIRIILKLL